MEVKRIIDENVRRKANMRRCVVNYNPYTGEDCDGDRFILILDDAPIKKMFLPVEMKELSFVNDLIKAGSIESFIVRHLKQGYSVKAHNSIWKEFCEFREEYDFEYWAAAKVLIEPKKGSMKKVSSEIPFILNYGQRVLLKAFETQRKQDVPIRIILCKARQWGGSTLTQIYMAWIQIKHRSHWNSVICAHVESTARIIKGMYDKLLKGYIPPMQFKPYQQSHKTFTISGLDNRVSIGSAEKPEGLRGEHTMMAHFSEVASFKKTDGKSPEDLIQSISSGILDVPYSMIVFESTAKGIGNYFHTEWLRAERDESGFTPVFVAWYQLGHLYSKPIKDYVKFIESMDARAMELWRTTPATLEQINWYMSKRKELKEDWRMKSEFPSNATEAFQSTGDLCFNRDDILRLRENCLPPIFKGDIVSNSNTGKGILEGIKLIPNANGLFKIWSAPSPEKVLRRYIVAVDIGGRSKKADYSVIRVFDRYYMLDDGVPELVAQWRGHIDHDLLAWLAARIACFYNNALLSIEINTLVTEGTEGDHGEFILDEVSKIYTNLYIRESSAQNIREGRPNKYGWFTSRQSKQKIIDNMVRTLREDGYIERDDEAVNEFLVFEKKDDGTFGAVEGQHDDIVMTTMIGVYICYDFSNFPLPEIIIEREKIEGPVRVRGYSDF